MTHELMIGNWVMYKGKEFQYERHDEFGRVVLIDPILNAGIKEVDPSKISPIPITPELLEKLGFEKFLGLDTIYKCGDVRVSYYFSKSVFKVSYKYSTIPDIAYVHQIQNLITILNGKI